MITTEQSRLNKEFLAQCTDPEKAMKHVPLVPNPSKDQIIEALKVTLGAFVATSALEASMSFPLSLNNTVTLRFADRPTKAEITALIEHLRLIAKVAPEQAPENRNMLNRVLGLGGVAE